jgi:putative phosphoesterase
LSDAATVGVISDTHGLLRPEAVETLLGSDLIVHAGDVGDAGILDTLEEIAPVRAVRGNVDRSGGAARLPFTEVVEVAGATLYVIHILQELDVDPRAAGLDAVIYGHTHRATAERREGVLWLNPGSAGPAPPDAEITLARLEIRNGEITPEIIPLAVPSPGRPPRP